MFLFGNMTIALQINHWPRCNCTVSAEPQNLFWDKKKGPHKLCTAIILIPLTLYNASGTVSQIYLWPTFWQIPLKLLTVSKHNITAMQMTFLLSQSAKNYRSVLPEGSVSQDLVLLFPGHMLHPNAMAEICSQILNRKSGVFFQPVILFLDCGETQEASYVKSKFKIFKTGLPGQLESVNTEESSLSMYTQHTPVGFLGV